MTLITVLNDVPQRPSLYLVRYYLLFASMAYRKYLVIYVIISLSADGAKICNHMSFVKSNLEYAGAVWNPQTNGDIKRLEKIAQWRVAPEYLLALRWYLCSERRSIRKLPGTAAVTDERHHRHQRDRDKLGVNLDNCCRRRQTTNNIKTMIACCASVCRRLTDLRT